MLAETTIPCWLVFIVCLTFTIMIFVIGYLLGQEKNKEKYEQGSENKNRDPRMGG